MSEERKLLIVETAENVIERAGKEGTLARLLGGVAVFVICPSAKIPPLAREINDMDIVIGRNSAKGFKNIVSEMGFIPDHEFNSIHGESRMLFYKDDIELDVFIGQFVQCHELDLEDVLTQCDKTIGLAALLLTKLQIVQINYKDILDILALLADHPVSQGKVYNSINLDEILKITGNDWGWCTTVGDNLNKVFSAAGDILKEDIAVLVKDKINLIRKAMEESPKSLKWKLRSKIGRKIQWYNLPEEK